MLKRIPLLLLLLLLSACSPTQTPTSVEEAPVIQPTPTPTPEPVDVLAMPELPDLDFASLNFFEDGYASAKVVSCTDGDTARFRINETTYATRFLAIDTPEVSGTLMPWGLAAKTYTCDTLQQAEVIVLQSDPESDVFDAYNRLLAWVWVDGELLQYKLVEESLAWVKYLYGDYVYNSTMIRLEATVQKEGKKIWGEEDPNFNYEEQELTLTIAEIETSASYGDTLTIEGIVTGILGNNFFLYDQGAAIYVYTRNAPYRAIRDGGIGARVRLTGDYILYNGLDEMSNIDGTIELLDSGLSLPESIELSLSEWGEAYESMLVHSTNLTIERIVTYDGSKDYDVYVSQDGVEQMLRIDNYLSPYIDPSFFEVGRVINAYGNLGQYVDQYQLMIRTIEDIEYVS
jgi:endonuclease YncB( thermonuclease family)